MKYWRGTWFFNMHINPVTQDMQWLIKTDPHVLVVCRYLSLANGRCLKGWQRSLQAATPWGGPHVYNLQHFVWTVPIKRLAEAYCPSWRDGMQDDEDVKGKTTSCNVYLITNPFLKTSTFLNIIISCLSMCQLSSRLLKNENWQLCFAVIIVEMQRYTRSSTTKLITHYHYIMQFALQWSFVMMQSVFFPFGWKLNLNI